MHFRLKKPHHRLKLKLAYFKREKTRDFFKEKISGLNRL